MTDERRIQPRVPIFLDVIWEATAGRYEARTSDVSVGGCFVDTVTLATQGETINFKLKLPSDEWIELRAIVAYAYPSIGFGVRFLNVPPETLMKLEQLVADRESR